MRKIETIQKVQKIRTEDAMSKMDAIAKLEEIRTEEFAKKMIAIRDSELIKCLKEMAEIESEITIEHAEEKIKC